MLVGLTIIAFGTSLPELVVNLVSAHSGATELAFGNVVGSNVANLALVLGAAALIRPFEIHSKLVQRELPLLLLATVIFFVMAMDGWIMSATPEITRSDGIVLILVFGMFLYITVMDVMRARQPDAILANFDSSPFILAAPATILPWLYIPSGVAMLYFGGELTVMHGVSLADEWQVPTEIIGMFVVAIGTSMPELVTTIIAAIRRESDLALGNVIGSNLFNTLFVLPSTALVSSVAIPPGGSFDILLSLLLAAALIPVFVLGRKRLGREIGALFLLVFVAWALARTLP
jgi:cation:H+ antiporter